LIWIGVKNYIERQQIPIGITHRWWFVRITKNVDSWKIIHEW